MGIMRALFSGPVVVLVRVAACSICTLTDPGHIPKPVSIAGLSLSLCGAGTK